MPTKLDDARAAVEAARAAIADHNTQIGGLVSQQQALRRRIEAGGLLEDPSLSRQVDDLGATIAYLRQQLPKLTKAFQDAERSAANVEAVARDVRRYLVEAEAGLGRYDWDISRAKLRYDLDLGRKEKAIDALRAQYDRLADLVGEAAALDAARENGRDLAALRGEPEPEPEPTPKRRFGK